MNIMDVTVIFVSLYSQSFIELPSFSLNFQVMIKKIFSVPVCSNYHVLDWSCKWITEDAFFSKKKKKKRQRHGGPPGRFEKNENEKKEERKYRWRDEIYQWEGTENLTQMIVNS